MFEPGFYCGTRGGVHPISYVDVPSRRIYPALKFVQKLKTLKPGSQIFGEFNLSDLHLLSGIFPDPAAMGKTPYPP